MGLVVESRRKELWQRLHGVELELLDDSLDIEEREFLLQRASALISQLSTEYGLEG